ncbi:TolC family protein [Echinicola shivajiensis]|uniref:TolC family protein n=1 Tax=Echinicola shivajiensis TaxID=1035916 RepID=UPI001BFC397E|nr:TolC family protein [Echinicola shivajiensis]
MKGIRIIVKEYFGLDKRKLGLFFVMALLLNSSMAQSLEDYLVEAGENNPGLKAKYAFYMSSLEKVPQLGQLPNPELSFGFFLKDMATLMGDQKMNVSLMQRFPWFGTFQSQKDEASLLAQANYLEFERAKYDLYNQVKQSYYQVYLWSHHRMIAEENLELLETMERLALNRFKGGVPGVKDKMTDVLRIQSRSKEVATLIEGYEDELELEQVKFNQLLNRPIDQKVNFDYSKLEQELMWQREVIMDSVRNRNPELIKLDVMGDAYQKKSEVANKAGLPSIGIGVDYMINSPRSPMGEIGSGRGYVPGGMGHNMVMPMVSLSLPIYRKKYKAARREAERLRELSYYQKEQVYNSLELQMEQGLKQIRDAERNLKLYQDQTALLQRSFDLMLAEYSSGDGNFEELLTVQQELLDFEMKISEAIVNKQKAIAQLESLMAKSN